MEGGNNDNTAPEEADPFTAPQRRELDHLKEALQLQMQNVKEKQETALERMIGELEKLRTDNAEMKSELQSQQLRNIGIMLAGMAVLLTIFGLILRIN